MWLRILVYFLSLFFQMPEVLLLLHKHLGWSRTFDEMEWVDMCYSAISACGPLISVFSCEQKHYSDEFLMISSGAYC